MLQNNRMIFCEILKYNFHVVENKTVPCSLTELCQLILAKKATRVYQALEGDVLLRITAEVICMIQGKF